MPDQFVIMLTEIGKAAEQAGPMRASSVIRGRGNQRRARQRAAVGVLSAVVVGAVVVGAVVATGSFLGMHRTATNLPAASPSVTADATASPTTATSPSSTVSPTRPATEASALPATATELSVIITGPTPTTIMTLGGPEADFTVAITNQTERTFSKIVPIVYAGHCTCSDAPVPEAPDGTMKVQQPDGTWKAVFFDHAAGGADYLGPAGQMQTSAFTLAPGATASFSYRIGFNATQQRPYHNGALNLEVAVVGLQGYTGTGPTELAGPGTTLLAPWNPPASAPIEIQIN